MSQRARKFEKVQAKKTREIIKKKLFFFGSFLTFFPSTKIDIWSFLKLQKIKFGQKNFHEIDLFDFRSFFAWTFSNFLMPCEKADEF